MNTRNCILTAAFFCAAFGASGTAVFAQGSLEPPPGPPEPSMKSLAQVEPRIPVSEPRYIEEPGSYYLTNDIVVDAGHAITIAADCVQLDLNGFTIRSVADPAGGRGIFLEGDRSNITLVNGFIQGAVTSSGGVYAGPGFGAGIYSDDADRAYNIRVRDVSVSGCQNNGIHLGNNETLKSSIVENCAVRTVGNRGIYANIVKNCVATDCGGDAVVGSLVLGCIGESLVGDGVNALVVRDCYGYSFENGTGIHGYTANNCWGFNSGNGTGLFTWDTAVGCFGATNSGTGLSTDIAIGSLGSSLGGWGLEAFIANSSRGEGMSGASENVTHRFDMPAP